MHFQEPGADLPNESLFLKTILKVTFNVLSVFWLQSLFFQLIIFWMSLIMTVPEFEILEFSFNWILFID